METSIPRGLIDKVRADVKCHKGKNGLVIAPAIQMIVLLGEQSEVVDIFLPYSAISGALDAMGLSLPDNFGLDDLAERMEEYCSKIEKALQYQRVFVSVKREGDRTKHIVEFIVIKWDNSTGKGDILAVKS